MTLSVNTNVGAMMALQTMNATNRQMETTQSRINTGLTVASTADDSAKYTMAQQLRGELGGLQAITSSLNNAKSTVDVAISGAEQISDILNKMKAKTLEAQDAGDSELAKINDDFTAYKEQMENIIASSEFNGKNLLSGGGSAGGDEDSVSAIMSLYGGSAGGSGGGSGGSSVLGAWSINTLEVNNQGLSGLVVDQLADVDVSTTADAKTAQTAVETAFASMQTVLGDLGSKSRRIDDQITFVSKLSDSVESGIGNLVDADLAKESANLQALQVKQQLGVQALAIANQTPQTILSLFK